MKQNITEYLGSIGMGEVLIEKVKTFHDQYIAIMEILEDSVLSAFVSEYVNEDGQRQYTTLLFFTETQVCEIENFLSDAPTIWLSLITDNLNFVGFSPKEYDFVEDSPASRLNIETRWKHGTSFILNLQASGNNCKQLLEVTRRYLLPNVL